MIDAVAVDDAVVRENYHRFDVRRLDFSCNVGDYQFVGAKCSYNLYTNGCMSIASI